MDARVVSRITVLHGKEFQHQNQFLTGCRFFLDKDAFCNEPVFEPMSVVTQRSQSLKREIKNCVKENIFFYLDTIPRCFSLNNLVVHVVRG